MTTEVELFYGNNGNHEFWESEGKPGVHVCIIRHPGREWFPLIPHGLSISSQSLSMVAREMSQALNVRLAFSPHRQYVPSENPHLMDLVEV